MTDPVIAARDVHKSFDEESALEGVDLDVYGDETTLLLGPNGSGKTILLSCLAGGLTPSAGEVSVFGRDPGEVGAATSFMLQDGLAFPQLTGRETVEFYTDLHPHADGDWERIAERLEIADDLDRTVDEYSGGMVRKLELVVTFAMDVGLYLLDEPTAELDMTTVDRVHALVRERRDEGRTVLVSSHRPVNAQLADRVAFVVDGRVTETGGPEALMADVPPVVVFDDATVPDDARDLVRAGRLFEADGERRGFLAPDASGSAVDDLGLGGTLADPTVGDMFNYYVHVRNEAGSMADDGATAGEATTAENR